MEITCIVLVEEIVLVFLKLLSEVEKILVVDTHITQVAPDTADSLRRGLFFAAEYIRLYLVKLLVHTFKGDTVKLHYLLEKVIYKAFEARHSPTLVAYNIADSFVHKAAVVDEYYALFVESKGEISVEQGNVVPVRDRKSTRQRVVVDLRFGGMDNGEVDIHFDAHIEFVPVLQPFRRRQHCNELTASAFEVQLLCFFKCVFDIVIHSLAPVIEDN